MRIVTLSENTAGTEALMAEWGLGVLVETDETVVLLDTGQGHSLIHNADVLGVDLKRIDKIVLSHGHFDHTGGLLELLSRMDKEAEIIAHPDMWQEKYSCRPARAERYIGVPFQQDELEARGARFHLTPEPVMISDSIMTTGEVPMQTGFENIDQVLFIKEKSQLKPDPLLDDQALIIKTDKGLIVILGCAHRGIINTLYHARQISGMEAIYMVIGGSHLMAASEDRLQKTITALQDLDVQKLGLCHCTGQTVIDRLALEFGDRFFLNMAGSVWPPP